MPRRNDISKIMVLSAGALVLIPAMSVFAQSDKPMRKITVVAKCDTAHNLTVERIFANPGGESWQEYKSFKEVPQLNGENGESIFAVKSSSGFNSVRWMYGGEDNSVMEEICFSKSGELRSLHYEMRTAWGWGYEEHKVLGVSGATVQRKKRFFDTASNRTIARPRQADDVPNFLEPEIYPSFNKLPFIAIYNKPRTDAPQK